MIVAGIVCAAAQCHTEPRWCSITGRGANDTMVYPPIARAARVQGVVVSRIVYAQNGEVVRMEPVFGPAMLSDSVSKQLSQWNIKTDATGGELCQSLIIADFRLDVPGTSSRDFSRALIFGDFRRFLCGFGLGGMVVRVMRSLKWGQSGRQAEILRSAPPAEGFSSDGSAVDGADPGFQQRRAWKACA